MNKIDQKGEINLLIIPLALVSILLIVAVIFGLATFKQKQNYQNNTDQIAAVRVKEAVDNQKEVDKQNYIEQSKQPLVSYSGPSDFGSLIVQYPKNYSVYVESQSNNLPVDGYGFPGQVPGTNSKDTAYALRFQITADSYSRAVQEFNSQLQQKAVTIQPYKYSKDGVNVVGVRVDGEIDRGKFGSMIILPLRSYTLKIWTEAPQFEKDFANYILPNYSFNP